MRDLLTIFIMERKTLLRGLLITFLIVFPFTFLPSVLKGGLTVQTIVQRIPDSTIYTFGFSVILVIVAVIQNYNNLIRRKKIFDKPVFSRLGFYGRIEGNGSIVKELETFLLGKINNYYFRINLIEPENGKLKIRITPLIDLADNRELKTLLKQKYGFREDLFWGLIMNLKEKDLINENLLLEKLLNLDKTLTQLGAKAIIPTEKDLNR